MVWIDSCLPESRLEETGSKRLTRTHLSAMRGFGGRAMRIFGMRIAGVLAAGFLGLTMVSQPGRLMAQAVASIHGHVQNPAAMAVTTGEVRLTTEKNPSASGTKFEYTFPIDGSGNYKGTDIKPGNYIAEIGRASRRE